MEILGVGIQELLLVAALIVIVVGPRRLPEMAYYLGRGVKKLQRYARVVRDEFSEEFAYLNEEMEAVRADVQEMRTTVTEVRDELQEVRGEVDEVTSEAVGELSDVRAGIEQVAAGAGESAEPASPAPGAPAPAAAATSNGAAAESDVNGAAPARGVAGPSYMPPIATAAPREAVAPVAATPGPAEEEVEDEAEAKPEKPLVF